MRCCDVGQVSQPQIIHRIIISHFWISNLKIKMWICSSLKSRSHVQTYKCYSQNVVTWFWHFRCNFMGVTYDPSILKWNSSLMMMSLKNKNRVQGLWSRSNNMKRKEYKSHIKLWRKNHSHDPRSRKNIAYAFPILIKILMFQGYRGWSSRSWIDFNVIFQTKMYLTLVASISDEIDHIKMEFT